VHKIFRVFACLESRGYIARPRPNDGYVLTMCRHELAHRHPPSERLLHAALPLMRGVAESARQSCHPGVYSQGQLHVIAQVESPTAVGFSVRLATGFPLLRTASGRVLLAFQPDEVHRRLRAAHEPAGEEEAQLQARLAAIRAQSYERIANESLRGITDISYPILDRSGHTAAALTVPYVELLGGQPSLEATREALARAATAIAAELGGRAPGAASARSPTSVKEPSAGD
jgi:DNA-binding IclR family transcriptional regulator